MIAIFIRTQELHDEIIIMRKLFILNVKNFMIKGTVSTNK